MAGNSVMKLENIVKFVQEHLRLFFRGDNSYRSGNVIRVLYDCKLKVIKGTVIPSMRKTTYEVTILLKDDDSILSGDCTCANGRVKCHHMVALLLHVHYNISATDKSCVWNKRTADENDAVLPVNEMFKRRKNKPFSAIGSMSAEKKKSLFDKLTAASGLHTGHAWLLLPEVPPDAPSIHVLEECLNSAELRNATDRASFLLETVRLTQEKIDKIEKKTVGQSSNPLWLIAKRYLLTASNFGSILKACHSKSYSNSLFKKLLSSDDLGRIKAVKWGRDHEVTARKIFEMRYNKKARPCGIILHESGVIGASPDALIDDDAVLEIKCPYRWRNCKNKSEFKKALIETTDYIVRIVNNKLVVNKDHEYYHQIQGQLHIANRDMCHLMIWTPEVALVELIERDDDWSENITRLINFYLETFMDHILTKFQST